MLRWHSNPVDVCVYIDSEVKDGHIFTFTTARNYKTTHQINIKINSIQTSQLDCLLYFGVTELT